MSRTLLLADDSVTIQRVIELTFADEDVRVVAVSDGDEAIARIDSAPPDIVLADVGMPGRSGYDVAAHIKNTPALAHIPVLLLTGAFEPVDEARAREAGCDGVLAKPFEPQLVIRRVRELLEQPPAADAGTVAQVAEDEWALPVAAAPAGEASANGDRSGDDYFDRLDAAFASLGERAPGPVAGPASSPAWPRADAPLAAAPAVAQPGPAAPAPLPALADAFAAILAAERESQGGEPAQWPVAAAAPAVGEDVIEEVVRRVLDRMTDRVVHDTVAETVEKVAERLVREEIDRIKSQIK